MASNNPFIYATHGVKKKHFIKKKKKNHREIGTFAQRIFEIRLGHFSQRMLSTGLPKLYESIKEKYFSGVWRENRTRNRDRS